METGKEKQFTIKKSHYNPFKKLTNFLLRYHLFIFFIVMITGVTFVIVLINQTLTETSNQQFAPRVSTGTIDQASLERIQSLHTSTQPTPPPTFPAGRINPFAE